MDRSKKRELTVLTLFLQNYTVPIDERPDCSAWSFSITKAYSATVRAGFIIYKNDPVSNHGAMVDTISTSYSMTYGLFRYASIVVISEAVFVYYADSRLVNAPCTSCIVNGLGMDKCSCGK